MDENSLVDGILVLKNLRDLKVLPAFPQESGVLPLKLKKDVLKIGLVKVDKTKLYGFKRSEIVDEDGEVCKKARLSLNDNRIYYDENVTWIKGIIRNSPANFFKILFIKIYFR